MTEINDKYLKMPKVYTYHGRAFENDTLFRLKAKSSTLEVGFPTVLSNNLYTI